MAERASKKETEATYRAIGRFVAEFSAIESMLRVFLGMEVRLRADFYDSIVTHDFALLCTAVTEVFSKTIEDKARLAQLKKYVSKCRELNDLRVRVVHGNWYPQESGGIVSHVSRRNLQMGYWVEMTSTLEKRADEACALASDIEQLFAAHRQAQQAHRKMQKLRAEIGKLTS